MQAFFCKVPSSNCQNNGIIVLPIKHFGGMSKRVIRPDSAPSCLAVGTLHPFLLTGLVDGSLWTNNPLRVVFAPKSNRAAFKLRLFQHEFRPVERWANSTVEDVSKYRGAVRILTGWTVEPNRTPRLVGGHNDELADLDEDADANDDDDDDVETAPTATGKTKIKAHKGTSSSTKEADETGAQHTRQPGTLHEPWSRITAVAWNPNDRFACWAAAAMGSGLVKVMDLGLSGLNNG